MTSDQLDLLPEDYTGFLESLKVRQTRLQAQRTVNTELIGLYWLPDDGCGQSAGWLAS